MYVCAMCPFETEDEAEAYEHDCMLPPITKGDTAK